MKDSDNKRPGIIRRLLGFEKTTKYESDYLHDMSLRTALYMSTIVIGLEIWMIIRFIVKYSIPRQYPLMTSLESMRGYFILLTTGLIMFLYALHYISVSHKRRQTTGNSAIKTKTKIIGNVMIIAFSAICLYFGVITSISDLRKGYQIICFLTMIMFTACLLIWRPYISLLMLIGSFCIFGYLGNLEIADETIKKIPELASAGQAEVIEALGEKSAELYLNAQEALADRSSYFFKWLFKPCMQKGDVINLITFFIALAMISISIYMQRLTEARKDEGLEEANRVLKIKAVTDELTGVPNLASFVEETSKLFRAAQKAEEENSEKDKEADKDTGGENVKNNVPGQSSDIFDPKKKVFLFINLTNFSDYNQKYGFEKGNEFLKSCAGIVRRIFDGDIYARSSDDHFVVLTDEDKAEGKLANMKAKVEAFEKYIRLSIKAGGYIPKSTDIDPRVVIDYARNACIAIKKRKNIYYQLYDERMEEEYKRKQYIINNLDEAIANGYVKPYYQPVVWAGDRTLCGAEALARWIDPQIGFLSPGAFIPVLEEYKEIHKLDGAIMKAVCRDIREHLDKGDPIVPISINFSRLDFELTDIVAEFEGYVEKYKVPKEYLHVEVTESALTEQQGILRDNINTIKEHGYPVWLDDFGSGYSTLNSLKDFSFDVMKIDMVFLKSFETNPKAGLIIENVINLAKDVDMQTLTEGVETDEQAEFLKKAGCGRLQGYYFGKPMPIEELDQNIKSGKYTVSGNLFE
ncbi:MAG: EAL domain-containing protein [Lachnospiraceae bacterium]|nr:EAL domain-containing protein [Lachnospiraceae bacterium]